MDSGLMIIAREIVNCINLKQGGGYDLSHVELRADFMTGKWYASVRWAGAESTSPSGALHQLMMLIKASADLTQRA
jgi:hypothetical protein